MGHLNSSVMVAAKNGTLGDLANDGPGGFIVATVVVLAVCAVIVGLAKLRRRNKG
jgi:hypothetical protein